jgi:hypothetical protein
LSSTTSSAPSTSVNTTSISVSNGPQAVAEQPKLKPLPPFQANLLQTSYPVNPLPALQTTISQESPMGVIPHPHPVPTQQQQQQRVIHQNNTGTFQTLSNTSLQMIPNMGQQLPLQQQQQQHLQQRQFFPQRIVRFVHPQQMSQRLPNQATAIVGQFHDRSGAMPFIQQGNHRTSVYQAIPVSIVSTAGPRGVVSRCRCYRTCFLCN